MIHGVARLMGAADVATDHLLAIWLISGVSTVAVSALTYRLIEIPFRNIVSTQASRLPLTFGVPQTVD
jgi:peptidoglycan/LPS O-acetylase OafA/YrhL